jgi:hypothetical protein
MLRVAHRLVVDRDDLPARTAGWVSTGGSPSFSIQVNRSWTSLAIRVSTAPPYNSPSTPHQYHRDSFNDEALAEAFRREFSQ